MSRRIKVIIDGEVLIHPHFSGIGHYTLELLKALDDKLKNEQNFEVSLLIYFRHTKKVRQYGFKHIKILPSPFSLRISNGLRNHKIDFPLDLIFGKAIYVFPNFTGWPLLFSKSIPIIYDLSYEKYPQFAEPRNQAFLSTQVRKTVKRAARILTISKNSKAEIADFYHYPKEQIDVAYPAVDKKHFYPRTQQEIDTIKHKYSISGNYILFVGNIEPRKNLQNLLLAYEQLPKKLRQEYSLLLVGAKGWKDGDIFKTIQRLTDHGDKVQLPSSYVKDEDLPVIYSGASLFVYPSLYEGFGIPPLEAMACEVPTVTSDNSSLPEACGIAAILTDATSVKKIAKSMEFSLTNPGRMTKKVEKGRMQVNRFSWDMSADILLNSIKQV